MIKSKVIVCFLMLFLICQSFFSQEIEEINFEKTDKSTRRINNPVALTARLIKGKTSDKEKFDAIYNWVVNNIDYNYKIYYSSGGVPDLSIKTILKSKQGVCIHYAYLMDTLCTLAELTNVTILGYAKDELFDVHDSIYIDTHAWNAVKLDGLWYLYDITFSSGEVFYRYTKFTKFINYLIDHVALKYVKIEVKPKRKFFFLNDCELEKKSDSIIRPEVKLVPMVRSKILLKLLLLFKPHVVRDYKKGLNPDYYLTQPELFGIEHFPDNPVWSLTASGTMQKFEGDSSFYHLNKHTFKQQKRSGKTCPECDTELSYNALNWSYNMRKRSLEFNPHNRFITSDCEYCIALVKFNEAKIADDSLAKVTLLDTAKVFLNYTRKSLRQSVLNLRTNYISQKDKNIKKVNLLMDENNHHTEFIISKIAQGNLETRNLKFLEDNLNIYAKKAYRRSFRIKKLKHGESVEIIKKKPGATILSAVKNYESKLSEIDSLNKELVLLKEKFGSLLPNLSNELWKRVKNHDSILQPLIQSTNLRIEIQDNFKKDIIEIRKKIKPMEEFFTKDLDSNLYKTSGEVCQIANVILQTIDLRNKLETENYKIITQLVKFGLLKPVVLNLYISRMYELNHDDFCWLRGRNSTYLKSILLSLKAIKGRQEAIAGQLRFENKIESIRSKIVQSELAKRKKKYSKIIKHRRNRVFRKANEIKKYKRNYLEKLREEQKKQKKRSK